jgi:hypothetical protein
MDLPNGNAFSFEIKTSTNQYECVSTLNECHDGLPLSLGLYAESSPKTEISSAGTKQ